MYNRYSASVLAEIGRYASRLGVAAAARSLSKQKLDSLICKRSYGFVYRQCTCPSRSVALSHIVQQLPPRFHDKRDSHEHTKY